MSCTVELIIDAKAIIGEGPCWDTIHQVLYWVDIAGKRVYIYNPVSGANKTIEIGQYVGAVVPRKAGGVVLACQNGFYFLDTGTEKLEFITDPEAHLPGNRFNDGKCDAAGRFWAGTMDDKKKNISGSLYYLDKELIVKSVFNNVSISNGIGWSTDNKTMYYIDTPTRQVTAFDYDIDAGKITNRRVIIEFNHGEGAPDGMTVDEEGMLWIAEWGGYRVGRWNPATGKLIQEIPVPVERVSSCTFGGPKLDELYITTASREMKEGDWIKQPHAGGVFKVKPGIRGLETYCFGG